MGSYLIAIPKKHFLRGSTSYRGFRAQRFYLNVLPVLGFLYHSKDLDEPDKPGTSVFLISQHMKSYKPSKKWSYLRLGLFSVCTKVLSFTTFDRTLVQTLIAPCIADRSGTKVLCAKFVANSILQRAQRFYQAR